MNLSKQLKYAVGISIASLTLASCSGTQMAVTGLAL